MSIGGHIASLRAENKYGGCHLHDDNHHETSDYKWNLLMSSRMSHTAIASDMTSLRKSMSHIDCPSVPLKSRGITLRLTNNRENCQTSQYCYRVVQI
jgi:hypothetical protein